MDISLIEQVESDIFIHRKGSFDKLGLVTNKYENEKVLVYLENKKYLGDFLNNKSVSCVICTNEIYKEIEQYTHLGVCISSKPKITFFKFHNYLAENTVFYGISHESKIAKSAQIHKSAYISEKNVVIGENVVIEPNATIHSNVIIKSDVIIRSGCVIGSEGYQFVRTPTEIIPVKHTGGVIINKHVEVQSNCCIDKGVLGVNTEIGEYTKFDKLVYVAHGVKINNRCFIEANATILGRVQIGNDTIVGPSSTICNGIKVGNNARITMGSVVTRDVSDNETVTGNFAINHDKFISFIKSIR